MNARLGVLYVVCSLAATAGELSVVDRHGRLSAMIYAGDQLNVRSTVAAPARGWTRVAELGAAPSTSLTMSGPKRSFEAAFPVGPDGGAAFRQTVVDNGSSVDFTVELTARSALDVEGVYFRLDVPRSEFLNGSLVPAGTTAVLMPATRPPGRFFWQGRAPQAAFIDAKRNWKLALRLDSERPMRLQDAWERANRSYALWIEMHHGPLAPGEVARLAINLTLEGKPDESPARLEIDASRHRYSLDGFGGNYCWDVQSPVAAYTLEHLQHGWTRTEMKLTDWEPENDNSSPDDTNWAYFESRDTPDSDLHRKFLFAKRLQDKGIPQVISVWRLPAWMTADTGLRNPWGRPRFKVDPAKWDEVLESIGSYLLYAKRKYGLEPELFGFNEPNIGASILFTAEEHRDALKRLGAHFEKLGLKTRLLLGGATGPKGTHEYVLPAAADPEAMRYVGAVGFHSWGGATPQQYAAWGDVAEWLHLPLLVTELGVDAFAFMGRTFDSYDYGIQEARQYQELLLYARPQGTMHWQFTADYALARPGASGAEPTPTQRFWLIKHFTDLTPKHSEALATSSNHPQVLITGFVRGGDYTFHILNSGAARTVSISGLPGIPLHAIQTTEQSSFTGIPFPASRSGSIEMQLPARSLTTLTTLAGGAR